MDDVEMSTNNGRRIVPPLEQHERVQTSSESGNDFSAGRGTKIKIEYHILLCWLNVVRVVVVNKNRDIFRVIMIDF
jgi:hypothetical protein